MSAGYHRLMSGANALPSQNFRQRSPKGALIIAVVDWLIAETVMGL